METKAKYAHGERVKLKLSEIEMIVNSITVFADGTLSYNLWDGFDKFVNLQEHLIEPVDEKKSIGFTLKTGQ